MLRFVMEETAFFSHEFIDPVTFEEAWGEQPGPMAEHSAL
jgi:hypothetical protein